MLAWKFTKTSSFAFDSSQHPVAHPESDLGADSG